MCLCETTTPLTSVGIVGGVNNADDVAALQSRIAELENEVLEAKTATEKSQESIAEKEAEIVKLQEQLAELQKRPEECPECPEECPELEVLNLHGDVVFKGNSCEELTTLGADSRTPDTESANDILWEDR